MIGQLRVRHGVQGDPATATNKVPMKHRIPNPGGQR